MICPHCGVKHFTIHHHSVAVGEVTGCPTCGQSWQGEPVTETVEAGRQPTPLAEAKAEPKVYRRGAAKRTAAAPKGKAKR